MSDFIQNENASDAQEEIDHLRAENRRLKAEISEIKKHGTVEDVFTGRRRWPEDWSRPYVQHIKESK